MIFLLVGAPGAGKGTQSKRLSERFEIPHLSTGDILRQAKANGSELGRRVAPILDSGHFVDDDLMVELVADRISQIDCHNGFLLDGFPRTAPQANALDRMLRGRRIDVVLELRVPEDEIRNRLLNRFTQLSDPRPEDRPEAIPTRIELFKQQTNPLIEFYKQRDLLLSVEGVGHEDQIFKRILKGIDGRKPQRSSRAPV